MSSFKSTFTREDGGEKNLQYDDAAFYYFFSALLLVITVPLTYSVITHLFKRKLYLNPCMRPQQKHCSLDFTATITAKERFSWLNWKLFAKVISHILNSQPIH